MGILNRQLDKGVNLKVAILINDKVQDVTVGVGG